MKTPISVWILLLFFSSVAAQSPQIERLNQQIEKNLQTQPDSAKIYMFRLLEHAAQLHDTVIANTYSNIGIQYNKLAVPDSAEFYMKKALPYAKNFPQIRAKMFLNLAINFRMGARYKESLAALDSALVYYKKAKNLKGEGVVYGEKGSNYNYMLDSERALEYLKKSIAILTQVGNDRELFIVKQKLANLYYNNGDYIFARDLYEEVLPFFKKRKEANYYYTLFSYADCLVQLEENYKEAEAALKEAEEGLRTLNNREYKFVGLSKLAEVYAATGRTNLADATFQSAYSGALELNSTRFMEIAVHYLDFLNGEAQYNQALKLIEQIGLNNKSHLLKMNAENEIDFLEQAVTTYSEKGMVEMALTSFERMDFLKDSIQSAQNKTKAMELQEAYQNSLQRERNLVLKKNNALLQENNRKKDKILYLSILVFALILAIGLLFFITNKNKLRLQKELVASLENSKKAMEQKNKLEAELLQERVRTLTNKEKELVQVSLEMSDLQNKILELIEQRENPECSQLLAKRIKTVLGQNNYWKYFKGKFVEVYPDFASQLQEMFPSFSEGDVAFCCMLKLQLSTQEIASLMGITQEQVESKKANLRRRMGLENDILAFEKLIDHLD
jgi:tetratricopeptide (TPR) repeat protein